jgi:hypothetical protein
VDQPGWEALGQAPGDGQAVDRHDRVEVVAGKAERPVSQHSADQMGLDSGRCGPEGQHGRMLQQGPEGGLGVGVEHWDGEG